MTSKNMLELFLSVCGLFLAGILTLMGLGFAGPEFTAAIIIAVYAAEILFISNEKRVIWGLWIFHLCCMLGLLAYLFYTGYINTGYWWSEELGHGNFDYHQEPASCWNIFWWIGGIRLTLLQIFHVWRHR